MRMTTGLLIGIAAIAAAFSLFVALAPAPPEPPTATRSDAPAPLDRAEEPPPPGLVADVAEALAGAVPGEDSARDRAAPRFDVVRVDPDGAGLAAGSAEPNAEISIRVDGETVATAQADAEGGFVAFFDAPRGGALGEGGPRRLDLAAVGPAGGARTGDPVIIAAPPSEEPDAEPVVIAAREDGIEILQKPAADSEADAVALDMAIQGRDGVLALSGRAGGLKPLRVYADARLVAETVADADGRWSVEADAAGAAGARVLRVEEIGPDGAVARSVEAPFLTPDPEAGPEQGEIVVTEGDTLWRLAENLFGDGPRYVVLYEANVDRIRDPDLIYPGQRLDVPTMSTQ